MSTLLAGGSSTAVLSGLLNLKLCCLLLPFYSFSKHGQKNRVCSYRVDTCSTLPVGRRKLLAPEKQHRKLNNKREDFPSFPEPGQSNHHLCRERSSPILCLQGRESILRTLHHFPQLSTPHLLLPQHHPEPQHHPALGSKGAWAEPAMRAGPWEGAAAQVSTAP